MGEDEHTGSLYQKFPVTVKRGSGALLWDCNDKEYVDLMGGYGVALVGHCNPRVVDAIIRQARQIITVHSSLYSEVRAGFLDKLAGLAPAGLGGVHLNNSGAESIEAAIKFARKYTGKKGMVAMRGSYHGKSMGALSLTFNPKYRRPFGPLLEGVSFSKFGDADSLQKTVNDDTAMVVVEPVQGESGIHVAPDGFLEEAREICDKKGILLVFDEVQAGLGRTGRLWAGSHWNVTPDILCIAKGLAGGVPMGATLTRPDILSCISKGEHSSTFGGNPLSCAAGSATLDAITGDGMLENARDVGSHIVARLQDMAIRHRVIREVRGLGLMIGVELRRDVRDILHALMDMGVVMLYSGRNVLRLLPPLVITRQQADRALDCLDAVLEAQK